MLCYVSAYGGVLGGVAMASLNNIHDQTIQGNNLTELEMEELALTVGVASVTGGMVKSAGKLGKNVVTVAKDLLEPLKNYGLHSGTAANVVGSYGGKKVFDEYGRMRKKVKELPPANGLDQTQTTGNSDISIDNPGSSTNQTAGFSGSGRQINDTSGAIHVNENTALGM